MNQNDRIPRAYDDDAVEIRPHSLAQCIVSRPTMFTRKGSLSEILALFSGYYFATQEAGGKVGDRSPADAFHWIISQTKITYDASGEALYTAIVERFGSESAALQALRQHLDIDSCR